MLTGEQLGAAIEAAIKKKGVSKVAVAHAFSVKPPSIQDWVKKGTISKDKLPKLWSYFADVVGPDHWGLTSYPEQPTSIIALHAEDDLPDGFVSVPEYTVRFSGGNGQTIISYELEESVEPATYRISWLQQERLNPKHLKRFKVTGDSMEPLLYPGDTVLVNTAENELEQILDGRVYAIRYWDDLRVKQLIYQRTSGILTLRSVNPGYKDEEVPPGQVTEHITIIGRVRDKSGSGGL